MSKKEVDFNTELMAKLKLVDAYRPSTPCATACGGEPFSKELTKAESANIRKAQLAFNLHKKDAKTQAVFDTCYDAAENCFELALKFHVQGVNYQDCKSKSFTFYVLEAFREYIRKRPEKYSILDDCMKLTAFHLTNKDSNGNLFKITAESFKYPESSHLFDDYVRDLIATHNYVRAAQVAQHTGLVHEDFIFGFLVPISFSRSNASVLYDYLSMPLAKELKLSMMRTLDSMLLTNTRTVELLQDLTVKFNYKDIPPENMTHEYLRKNIPKLRKSLNVPMDITPNSARLEIIGVTVFRLTSWIQKMISGEVNATFFEVKIKSLVSKENQELQMILLTKLLSYNLDLECLKWILYFDMDAKNLPSFMQSRIDFVVRQEMEREQQRREMQQREMQEREMQQRERQLRKMQQREMLQREMRQREMQQQLEMQQRELQQREMLRHMPGPSHGY